MKRNALRNKKSVLFFVPGSEWMPQHDAGRVLVTTWLMASLVFMSSYGGILTAMLTVPRVIIPIDSLADLVAQDDLPWRLESGAMMLTYLQVNALLRACPNVGEYTLTGDGI